MTSKDKLLYLIKGKLELVSDDYKNSRSLLTFRCLKCGELFKRRADTILYKPYNNTCPYCSGHIISKKEFLSRLNEVDTDFILVGKFYGAKTKTLFKCTKCGYTYKTTPYLVTKGHKCPKCSNRLRKTTDEFAHEINELTNNQYQLLSQYVNNRTNVLIKHRKCNHTYYVKPHDFLRGNRCPYCKQSKGEQTISNILDKYNIDYQIQYSFDDLFSLQHSKLPFDFYLTNTNILIEYDGVQHYQPVKYFGGKAKLASQQRRDNIKNNYVINNDYVLIRVAYNCDKDKLENSLINLINKCKAECLKSTVKTIR